MLQRNDRLSIRQWYHTGWTTSPLLSLAHSTLLLHPSEDSSLMLRPSQVAAPRQGIKEPQLCLLRDLRDELGRQSCHSNPSPSPPLPPKLVQRGGRVITACWACANSECSNLCITMEPLGSSGWSRSLLLPGKRPLSTEAPELLHPASAIFTSSVLFSLGLRPYQVPMINLPSCPSQLTLPSY